MVDCKDCNVNDCAIPNSVRSNMDVCPSYKGISRERLTEIQRIRFPHAEPVLVEQEYLLKVLENNTLVMQVNSELEKMQRQWKEDTEMSIVVEMAKMFLESMTPHEVKLQGDSFMCTACLGWFKKHEFDFCPWCGKRIKW